LVFVESKAKKQFKRFPKENQNRMIIALKTLEDEGLSTRLDIKKLQGYQNYYRIRIGKIIRILFELSADQTIVVYSISTREKAYE
jgi:mRNA-degrading endonuclease RelE of RelBE toxin-antitoxin system